MEMMYNIREYKPLFSGRKEEEEVAVVAIIMTLLNNNKFDNIDDVLKYNGNDYRTFMKNNRKDNVPSHFGNSLNDTDFKQLIVRFKEMVDQKLSFDKENINEINFDNKEYVEYDGHVVDNSYADRSIEKELQYKQEDNIDFQTLDAKENTDRMMNEVINDEKREVEFKDLSSINREVLDSDEKRIYDAALVQEHLTGDNIQLSTEDGLTKNDQNDISRLSEDGSNIRIEADGQIKPIEETSINQLSLIDRDSLTPKEKELYDAAKKYESITGEVIRLDLKNEVIITPYDEIKNTIIGADGSLVVDDPRVIFHEETMTTDEEKEKEKEQEKTKKLVYPLPLAS